MGLFSGSSKSKTKVTPYDEGQLQRMLDRLDDMGNVPAQFYPGRTYAAMDPRQTQALRMREQFAGGGLGQMVDPALDAWHSTLSAPDAANNPYVQNMIDQQATTLTRNLSELMPVIESNMLGVNDRLGGSGEGVAKGIAARGTQEALAEAAAKTQMGAYSEGLGQQRFGLGAAPGMASFGMMPADVLAGVGGAYQADEQRAINEAMQRHNFGQQEPWQRLQNQAAIFAPLTLPFAATESKSKSSPSAFSVGSSLASIGMGGMDLFGGGGMLGGGGGIPNFGAGTPGFGGGVPAGAMGSSGMPAWNSFADPRTMFSGAGYGGY